MSQHAALEACGPTKHFGNVVAPEGADFELRAGEILAVIGDNRAGKSTLIKALAGAVNPDAGEIRMKGRRQQHPEVLKRTATHGTPAMLQMRDLSLGSAMASTIRALPIDAVQKATSRHPGMRPAVQRVIGFSAAKADEK